MAEFFLLFFNGEGLWVSSKKLFDKIAGEKQIFTANISRIINRVDVIYSLLKVNRVRVNVV